MNTPSNSVPADEVTIFGNQPPEPESMPYVPEIAPDFTPEEQAAVAYEAVQQLNPEPATHELPPAAAAMPSQLVVDSVKLRPSHSLLVLRLLGIGVVILGILLLIGFFFNVLYEVIGGPISSFFENRMILMSIGMIVYLCLGFVVYKQWSSIFYLVYADRIHVEKGWILRKRYDMDMTQFGGAVVEQTIAGRILNYGTIRLLFRGAVSKIAGQRIADIADPFENYKLIMGLIRTE